MPQPWPAVSPDQQNETDLASVQEGRPQIPAGSLGKLAAGKHTLYDEEKHGNGDDERDLNHFVSLSVPRGHLRNVSVMRKQNGGSAGHCVVAE